IGTRRLASSAPLICRPRPGPVGRWNRPSAGLGDFRRPSAGVASCRSTRKALSYAAGLPQDGDWRCGRSSAASGAAPIRRRVPPPREYRPGRDGVFAGRDLVADWKKWSRAERILAAVGTLLRVALPFGLLMTG